MTWVRTLGVSRDGSAATTIAPAPRGPRGRVRSGRATVGGLLVGAVLLVVPAGAVGAAEGDLPPTTEPPTTVPTTEPAPSPTLPAGPPPTTTTTLPATPPTIPEHPTGEQSALSPAETAAAQAELATLTDAQRALLRQLQSARDNLAARRFALVALAREVAAAQARLEEARGVEQEARAKVAHTVEQLRLVKEEILGLAAAAYRNHTETWVLGAIGSIDAGHASNVTRAKTYAQSDLSLLNERVAVLRALERRLEADQRRAEEARAAAEASAADLDARLTEQKEAYDGAAAATDRAQSAAARSLGSDARLIAQMTSPQFGADSISAVLGFTQAGQGDPATLDGIFTLPVPGAVLSSPFGLRIDPMGRGVGFHAGLDFAVGARNPIHAAADGMVVVAGDCGGYGRCVVIDHGASLGTLYGHQSELLVQVGDTVTRGQVIGLVGSTGISTGPHLHFEVRFRGTPIDPVPTLAG